MNLSYHIETSVDSPQTLMPHHSRFQMKDAHIPLTFLSLSSIDPREVQASDGDGKQLNGLKDGTALGPF